MRTVYVLALLVGTLLVGGCGDRGPSEDNRSLESQPGASPSTPVLETAVRAYSSAYMSGDGERAYGLLSDRCQNELAKNEFLSIVAQANQAYGDARITAYEDDINGNVGVATYELSDASLNQTQERWVLDDGSWHNDDC